MSDTEHESDAQRVMDESPCEYLESERIVWCRDWDALLIGFGLGVLATLAWVR